MKPGDVTAAILAGGKATRLGGACKPLIEIRGRRILDRQLDVLRPLCAEVILIANDASPFAGYDLRIVPDLHPGTGPLAGLEAALAAAKTEWVLLIGGDLPFVKREVIELLLGEDAGAAEAPDAIVPWLGSGSEPLCALYARALLPRVRERIELGQLAMRRFLETVEVRWVEEERLRRVDEGLEFAVNVNTQGEVERYR